MQNGTLESVQAKESGGPPKACPLFYAVCKASIPQKDLKGHVGIPLVVRINLTPFPPPGGFFYASTAEILKRPKGPQPEILPGDREIRVRCLVPGNYQLLVRMSVIAKSSCGGAKARVLREEKVRLWIRD